MNNMRLDPILKEAAAHFTRSGKKAYLVGGRFGICSGVKRPRTGIWPPTPGPKR
jgi:hypothetical protein